MLADHRELRKNPAYDDTIAIDRQSGNLAMARHKLTAIEQALVV